MKVIFLDHDGVLVPFNSTEKVLELTGTVHDLFDPFDKECVKILNEIIEKTDAEIVISSVWRHYVTLEQMQDLYSIRGILKSPIDYIPDNVNRKLSESDSSVRAKRIKKWLKSNPTTTQYVIIDDMPLDKYFDSNVVITHWDRGLTDSGAKAKILHYLK